MDTKGKFLDQFVINAKAGAWLALRLVFIPIFFVLLMLIGLLPMSFEVTLKMVSGVFLFVIGLPLSAAVQADRFSESYPSLSQEQVLILSAIVAIINVTVIVAVKRTLVPTVEAQKDE